MSPGSINLKRNTWLNVVVRIAWKTVSIGFVGEREIVNFVVENNAGRISHEASSESRNIKLELLNLEQFLKTVTRNLRCIDCGRKRDGVPIWPDY